MIFKYKGKEMEVPANFIIMCGEHAEQRGMTLEEYIAEAFTMLETGWDANGSPTNETSCSGTPDGWIPKEKFEKTVSQQMMEELEPIPESDMDYSGAFESDIEYDIEGAAPVSKKDAERGSW